jgi:hypothetical protein
MNDSGTPAPPSAQRPLWKTLIPIGVGIVLPTLLFAAYALHYRSEAGKWPTLTIPAPGSVIFYDDFGDTSGGWGESETYMHKAGYVSGEYRVAVLKPDTVVWQLALYQGLNATNQLRVVCDGDRFDFYVNDALLTSLSDDTFGSGYFGLAVGTGEPGVVVHFDNMWVHTPSE